MQVEQAARKDPESNQLVLKNVICLRMPVSGK